MLRLALRQCTQPILALSRARRKRLALMHALAHVYQADTPLTEAWMSARV